jgi:predicted transcriptional regulator
MKRGRKPSIGTVVLNKAQLYRTVAELAKATGADPHTVRDVLRRAADRGEIVLKRFVQGKSGRAISVRFE